MLEAIKDFAAKRESVLESLVSALTDPVRIRKKILYSRKYDDQEYSPIRDALKDNLWEDLLKATGRFFLKPANISFPDYVQKILSSPVSHLCLDLKTPPEKDDLVVLFPEDDGKNLSYDVDQHLLADFAVVLQKEGECHERVNDTLIYLLIGDDRKRTHVITSTTGFSSSFCRVIPNQSQGDEIRIGDIVYAQIQARQMQIKQFRQSHREQSHTEQSYTEQAQHACGPGREASASTGTYVVLYIDGQNALLQQISSESQGLYLLQGGYSPTKVQVELLEKAQAPSVPVNDARTQEELKALVKNTVYTFFEQEGLFKMYDLWKQLLITWAKGNGEAGALGNLEDFVSDKLRDKGITYNQLNKFFETVRIVEEINPKGNQTK